MINYLKSKIYYNVRMPLLKNPRSWYVKSDETDKYQHILEAVNYVRVAELPPVFFEFGCHSGRTFSAAMVSSQYLGLELDCYAFDSFEGLPQTDKAEDGYFQSGTFCTGLDKFKMIVMEKTGRALSDDHLVKGFYEQTLNSELRSRLPRQVGFVHIDVDLYSSTVTVLEFIKEHLVTGTVLLFDDWYCFPPGRDMGEKKALGEFCLKYPHIKFEPWKNYSTFGKSFFVEISE